MQYFKRLAAILPASLQEELKRYYFARKIKRNQFVSPEPEFRELHNYVSEGDWVIDIGANIGSYTILLSNLVGRKGRVIAFEPIPVTFLHLSENVRYIKHSNVTLINAAASDKCEQVNMSIPHFDTGLKNYYQASITSNSDDAEFSAITLPVDTILTSNKVSLIKIDAEGYEPAVIRGAKKIIERDRPTMVIETVTDEIRQYLIGLDYVETRLEKSPNVIFKHS